MRKPCCDKEGTNKGAWSKQEDQILIDYIRTHGEGCWRSLPKAAGLHRCGKSCRLRWINYLRPDIKRGNFGQDEEDLIIKLHALLGNRWSLIAGRLPGRTDNEVKNYWNSHIRKKLIKMGIDPNNHRLNPNHHIVKADDDDDDDQNIDDETLQVSTKSLGSTNHNIVSADDDDDDNQNINDQTLQVSAKSLGSTNHNNVISCETTSSKSGGEENKTNKNNIIIGAASSEAASCLEDDESSSELFINLDLTIAFPDSTDHDHQHQLNNKLAEDMTTKPHSNHSPMALPTDMDNSNNNIFTFPTLILFR